MNAYLLQLRENVLDNKYTNWYMNIIQNSLQRSDLKGYVEKHHILPKCFGMGGESDHSNIAVLTGREHFICHLLLVKMISDKILRFKLSCASLRMCYTNGSDRHKVNSTMYEIVKKNLSKNKKGIEGHKWTESQREKLKSRIPHNKGKPMSKEQKQKLREIRQKQKMSPRSNETKIKLRQAFLGKPRSEETKRKMKESNQRTCSGLKWWNNGFKNCRSILPPGKEWNSGRI